MPALSLPLATSFQEILDIELIHFGDTSVTIASSGAALLVLLGTYLLSRLASRAVRKSFQLRHIADEGRITVTQKLLQHGLVLIGFCVAMEVVGFNLSSLFAAGAIFAVGVGFAMQTIVQNFVSGVILMFEHSITPGDVLLLEGEIVRVTRMGIRSTTVVNVDGAELLVPNSNLVQGTVTNYTLMSPEVRLKISVRVSYESDLDRVDATLHALAAQIHDPSAQREWEVILEDFHESAVIYSVLFSTTDPLQMRALKASARRKLWDAFKEAEIKIAYPQLDVHMSPAPFKLAS